MSIINNILMVIIVYLIDGHIFFIVVRISRISLFYSVFYVD